MIYIPFLLSLFLSFFSSSFMSSARAESFPSEFFSIRLTEYGGLPMPADPNRGFCDRLTEILFEKSVISRTISCGPNSSELRKGEVIDSAQKILDHQEILNLKNLVFTSILKNESLLSMIDVQDKYWHDDISIDVEINSSLGRFAKRKIGHKLKQDTSIHELISLVEQHGLSGQERKESVK